MSHDSSPHMLSPGFRFHPTDEELVWYYLRRKVARQPFKLDAIAEADIYKFEPWDLPEKSRLKTRDLEWYFFSALDKKYGNGVRINRSTNKGYWKTTGKDRFVRHESQLIGMKKTLVFHSGRAPGGERTNWVMHEYRLTDVSFEKSAISKDVFVICRVFQKSGLGPPNGDRYAPFIEKEWHDNDPKDFFLAGDFGDEVIADDVSAEGTDLDRDKSAELDNSDDDCPPLSLAIAEPFPIISRKRQMRDDPEPLQLSASDFTSITQDGSASNVPLEFSLFESVKCEYVNRHTIANINSFLPAPYSKMFNDMRNEIRNVSTERAVFKIELMSAQAMINVLQSRVDFLTKENEDLRRAKRGG